MKRLIAGNWKMNGLRASLAEARDLDSRLTADDLSRADVLICPPLTLLAAMKDLGLDHVGVGAQDCHAAETGAHTGCVSAEMLAEAGATHVIVGHSERRADQGETSPEVKAKAEACHRAGLTPIVCVGEELAVREAGNAVATVSEQVRASWPDAGGVLAYEPIWAIGTGKVPTSADIAEMHSALREIVGPDTPVLYGGSVKPGNAAEILAIADVNGALVGGASLTAEDFYGIVSA